jgi:hypothetical protein
MSVIYYQDWIVKAGDPPALVLGHLFKALHGMMRKHKRSVVIVPIDLDEDFKPVLKVNKGAPAGLRIYMNNDAKKMVSDHLTLSGAVLDSVIAKPVVESVPQSEERFVVVRRLSGFARHDGNAEIQRFMRRNPGVDPSGKIAATQKMRSKRQPSESASFINVANEQGSYRVYLSLSVTSEVQSGERLFSQNTYGAGYAPLADLA